MAARTLVFIPILLLLWVGPSVIKAQCSIRPNLAAMHHAEIPIVWDALSTTSIRLAPVLLGSYRERVCGTGPSGNGTEPVNGNMTRAQEAAMRSCTTRQEETLEISFECVFEKPRMYERCITHKEQTTRTDHDGEEMETRWTTVSVTPAACLAEDQDTLRCLIRPVLDPKYEALWTRYQNAKNFWDPVRFNRAFAGTEFPWTPCHDPALYTDNAIRIVNFKEAAKRNPSDPATPIPVETRPKVELGWCELASDLALSSAPAAEWLAWARTTYPDRAWTSAHWELVPSGYYRDECERYWNQHQLVLKAGAYERRIAYNMTRSQPILENPFVSPGVIEVQRQCYAQAQQEARGRMERERNRALVRARHPCHPSNANGNQENSYFTAEYKWDWADFPLSNAPDCMNSGQLTHIWRAQSCGAHTDNWVLVRVRDTHPPSIRDDFVRVHSEPGRPLQAKEGGSGWIWNTCMWPENGFTRQGGTFRPLDDIPRLVRRELLHSTNPMFEDQCDSLDQLQVLVDWSTAVWEYCSLMQDQDGAKHLICTAQPQLNLAELAPEGASFAASMLKVRDENLAIADAFPRLLRMKVEVRVGDACANVQFGHPVVLQIGFFDPLDHILSQYKSVQCPHFRYQ